MMQSRFLRPALSVAAALAALSSWPVHAAGSVEVVYVEPEKFADIGRSA